MKIFKYLEEDEAPVKGIVIMTAVSGLANALLLAIVNLSAEMIWSHTLETRYLAMYLVVFVLYGYTQKYALSETIVAVETLINKTRLRIADKLRRVELDFVEAADRGDMYTRLTQESNIISQSTLLLITAAQSLMVLIFSFMYLAFLSPLSFVLNVVVLALAIQTYIVFEGGIRERMQAAAQKEARFFSYFGHLIDGFKELKINRAKSDDLFRGIARLSRETEDLRIEVGSRQVVTLIFGRMVFYVLLGLIVFVVPVLHPSQSEDIYKIATTVLFIIGPIGLVLSAMPAVTQSNVALGNLDALERELDQAIAARELGESKDPPPAFETLGMCGVGFSYQDRQGRPLFSVGPLNLTLRRGELLFVVGGNGSGKSTLLKLLAGLYLPDQGTLVVDGKALAPADYAAYRELFAIVFTDFHLFDRLYGLPEVDAGRVAELLRLLQLETKTRFHQGEFSHLNLSTGQKKRLAFLTAVLEDKAVYLFDELAADQDPQFRRFFYESILPDLQRQGRTIVAVTHDDRWFQVADRVLKMEEGGLVEYQSDHGSSGPSGTMR